jgi:hypothetical protein
MGRIQIVLDDETEKEFRQKLGKEGFRKGDISKIVEKLIRNYLKKK